MPIISTIGRRTPKVIALITGIYVFLVVGSVTMIYPFLIMVSGSTKSGVDKTDFLPYPRFLFNDQVLYQKHLEGLFNESLQSLKTAYSSDVSTFATIPLPGDPADANVLQWWGPTGQPSRKLADAWWQFVEEANLPRYYYTCGYVQTPVSKTVPLALRQFKDEVSDRYDGDLGRANEALGTNFVEWFAFILLPEQYLLRRERPVDTPLTMAFTRFKKSQPRWNLYFFSPEGFYKTQFIQNRYTKKIAQYNKEHKTDYESYDQVHLARSVPDGNGLDVLDWETFVRETLNLLWIRADASALEPYRQFLHAKYIHIGDLNKVYGTTYASFEDIPLVDEPPAEGILVADWEAFIKGWRDPITQTMHKMPVGALRIHSLDFLFRDWLQERFGSIDQINAALDTRYTDVLAVAPPQKEAHWFGFQDVRGQQKWEFTTRNFKTVLDYMVFHGRGVLNTVIYCTLAVLFALLVNPLAAYAMSRFKMPTTYKILLFLMLTMAFPPMVAQIPSFLMLRQFGLLNTFAALILPGLANGYSIFLLKGFFDSLPQELYESASLDGAGEFRIFWQITMSLSKPILAVIALGAFTAAYSNFMFALLICQDSKMWTLMVWLYQLQQISGEGVLYASLLIAAIPTLLIFIFCQNIILRGIVVPVEK